MNNHKKSYGFSLVELAIVIVIISIIVAGVLAGQAVVNSAQLRKLYSDFVDKEIAVNAFYSKFDYLPGDFPSAYSLWGTSCNAVQATCDGDGDGLVEDNNGEWLAGWRHLSLAGLVKGDYTGVILPSALPGSEGAAISINLPKTVRDSSMSLYGSQPFGVLASKVSNGNSFYPVITYNELLSMDTKYDDGVVSFGEGKIRGQAGLISGSRENNPVFSPNCSLGSGIDEISCVVGNVTSFR